MTSEYTTIIHRFEINHGVYFYVQFSLDCAKKYMAVGNSIGETFVWNLNSVTPTKSTVLRHRECFALVRQTAFSPDGKILICVCDDGRLFRWNME